MSVEKIIALIEREAEDEAARIVAAAEAEARDEVAAAEADVETRVAAALERVGPEVRSASQRRINAVRLRLLEDRARDDASRLSAVFDLAEARLVRIADGGDAARWHAALGRLCADALASVGEGASVSVRSCDAPAVTATARGRSAHLLLLDDGAAPGFVATSADARIEVDARLSVRVARARPLLSESVAQLLALQRGGVGFGVEG